MYHKYHKWNDYILIKISLKFVLKGLIDNKPALAQIIIWNNEGI